MLYFFRQKGLLVEETNNPTDQTSPEEKIAQEKAQVLNEKYKKLGAQTLSYKEYLALKQKQQHRGFNVPIHIKFILATPFIIIFCYGVFYIPYMLYLIATSPENHQPTKANTEQN
jgi:hypothetical protein